MTYDVKYTALEPSQLSDNPPSFDIHDTDDHVIAYNAKEPIVTMHKYWRGWWWQHQRMFQFCRLEVEELYNGYISCNIQYELRVNRRWASHPKYWQWQHYSKNRLLVQLLICRFVSRFQNKTE